MVFFSWQVPQLKKYLQERRIGGVGACSRVYEFNSMKLGILQLAIFPILPVVGCTLGCCTEIPTRARICDR